MRAQTKWRSVWVAGGVALLLFVGGFLWVNLIGFDSWTPLPATSTIDGKAADLEVYRSSRGELAIVAPDELIVYSNLHESVGAPNHDTFRKAFGRLWTKPGRAFLGVQMTPGGNAKIETDPKLISKPGLLEFTPPQGGRWSIRF